jgi:membrane protease YdiL (CAAX protease family)
VATPVTQFLMRFTGRVGDRLEFTAVRWVLEGWGPSPSLWQAALSATAVGIALTGLAGALVAWAIRHGLQGRPADRVEAHATTTPQRVLLRDPLHRKELLWFRRDAGAWVQTLLVPMTLVLYNLFQMRLLLKGAVGTWHGVCGIATLVGSFFLASLGPKSLASEGSALWIPLTWPIGLERLLETKARFWWMLSLGISGIGFAMAWVRFPEDALPIALAAVSWVAFSLALARKSVTLVQVPTSSGEIDRVPQARQWVVFLGTMSFSSGLLSGNWHAMVLGLAFSILSAAALWQDLRVRLPHLFDPWSEPIPEAPTLMHSLLAILGMVEAVAIIGSVARAFAAPPLQWMVTTVTYGAVGGITWIILSLFLSGRGVRPESLWTWEHAGPAMPGTLRRILVGVCLGGVLGAAALGYQEFVAGWPALFGEREDAGRLLTANDVHRGWLLATVVILAPWTEEFLFRGMFFRALDRAWGPTRALWASAAFFAVYHPPVAWLPVFCVGLAYAWLFRRSGRLVPCALLHMTYNAVVTSPWWLHEVASGAPSP